MMQTAKDRNCRDGADRWGTAENRRTFGEPKDHSGLVGVWSESLKDMAQVRLAEYDHVAEPFATNGSIGLPNPAPRLTRSEGYARLAQASAPVQNPPAPSGLPTASWS